MNLCLQRWSAHSFCAGCLECLFLLLAQEVPSLDVHHAADPRVGMVSPFLVFSLGAMQKWVQAAQWYNMGATVDHVPEGSLTRA